MQLRLICQAAFSTMPTIHFLWKHSSRVTALDRKYWRAYSGVRPFLGIKLPFRACSPYRGGGALMAGGGSCRDHYLQKSDCAARFVMSSEASFRNCIVQSYQWPCRERCTCWLALHWIWMKCLLASSG